ncbi:MAG: MaoC/PaaZ C-terminal domain-containing protein [Anaerolineaceae bacterium]
MDTPIITQRGLYFEEFEIGQQIVSMGRTITESDIGLFAGLSGDFNQLHTDEEYAKNSLFGRRVAHGMLILAIASGLAMRTGILEGTTLAFREISEWKFSKPVFIGDTIHVVMKVIEKKEMRRIGGGEISVQINVINQHDEMVMKGIWNVLVAAKG